MLLISSPIILVENIIVFSVLFFVPPPEVTPGLSDWLIWLVAMVGMFALIIIGATLNAIGWHRIIAHPNRKIALPDMRRFPVVTYIKNGFVIALPSLVVFAILAGAVRWVMALGLNSWLMRSGSLWAWKAFTFYEDYFTQYLFLLIFSVFGLGFPAVALGHSLGFRDAIRGGLSQFAKVWGAITTLTLTIFVLESFVISPVLYWLWTPETYAQLDIPRAVFQVGLAMLYVPVSIAILTLTYLTSAGENQHGQSEDGQPKPA
ncbi:MAG: hypothetical protein ACRBB0_19360 [Pelagimonas sp.]|uniref:hypothetical protein n=1 Tax=Pelagimonas sp. TaxID=2073170 RepID=UPI003D6A65C3